MKEIILSLVVATIAYLLGCCSTGLMIARSKGVDIRAVGSHNVGASNVQRVLGTKLGVITLVGDFFKAIIACWIGSLLLPSPTFGIAGFGSMLGGLFVIFGHNWPVFFGFKGGKGVACSAAVVIFVDPLLGGIACIICIIVIAIWRYISLGSLLLLFTFMVENLIFHWDQWFRVVFSIVLFVLCAWSHKENVKRLLKGQERKLGKKTNTSSN